MSTEIFNLDDIITSDIEALDKMHALKDQIPQMNDKLIKMNEEGIVSDIENDSSVWFWFQRQTQQHGLLHRKSPTRKSANLTSKTHGLRIF